MITTFISDNGKKQMEEIEKTINDQITASNFTAAFYSFDKLLNGDKYPYPTLFQNLTGMNYYYNIRYDRDPNMFGDWRKYVQTTEMRAALHVGQRTLNQPKLVEQHLLDDIMKSVSPWLSELLNNGSYRVLLYSGQLDIIMMYRNTMNLVQLLNWSGAGQFMSLSLFLKIKILFMIYLIIVIYMSRVMLH